MRVSKIYFQLYFVFLIVVTAIPMLCFAADSEASEPGQGGGKHEIVDMEKAKAKIIERVLERMASPEFKKKLYDLAAWLPPMEERPVEWQVQALHTFIADMNFITPDRLLINYTFKKPVLYDVARGEVLWQFEPEGWDFDFHNTVAVYSDLILISAEKGGEHVIAAIGPDNGKQLWHRTFETKKRSVRFLPAPAAGVVLALELEKKKAYFSAYDLFSGKLKWKEERKLGRKGHPPAPIATLGHAWHFYGKTTRFDPATGKTLWDREDLHLDNHSPLPYLENGFLYIITQEKNLHRLVTDSGESSLEVPLSADIRYTNVFPMGERIYLRGERGEGEFVISALDSNSGQVLWTYSRDEPTVSNLIREEGKLFVSTPSTVLCLDDKSGRELFASPASQTGQTFPVRLRKFDNTLVYVGELVIVGFDAVTGKRKYFNGVTPVSQEEHLDALDNWMTVLQERIGKLSKMMWYGGTGGAANVFIRQAEISQNLSNQYRDQAMHFRLKSRERYNLSANSDYWKSVNLRNHSKIESAYASATAQLGFFFAMEDMKHAVLANARARDQSEYNRLERIRKSIYSAYTGAESDIYAYRPHVQGEWLGVNLVHLPSGRNVFIPLCQKTEGDYAYWNSRGIWHRIDFENKLIYHHALRILPDDYQNNPSRRDGTVGYGFYLTATKVKMP
jgi:outer membrane protein assembly factor BamB